MAPLNVDLSNKTITTINDPQYFKSELPEAGFVYRRVEGKWYRSDMTDWSRSENVYFLTLNKERQIKEATVPSAIREVASFPGDAGFVVDDSACPSAVTVYYETGSGNDKTIQAAIDQFYLSERDLCKAPPPSGWENTILDCYDSETDVPRRVNAISECHSNPISLLAIYSHSEEFRNLVRHVIANSEKVNDTALVLLLALMSKDSIAVHLAKKHLGPYFTEANILRFVDWISEHDEYGTRMGFRRWVEDALPHLAALGLKKHLFEHIVNIFTAYKVPLILSGGVASRFYAHELALLQNVVFPALEQIERYADYCAVDGCYKPPENRVKVSGISLRVEDGERTISVAVMGYRTGTNPTSQALFNFSVGIFQDASGTSHYRVGGFDKELSADRALWKLADMFKAGYPWRAGFAKVAEETIGISTDIEMPTAADGSFIGGMAVKHPFRLRMNSDRFHLAITPEFRLFVGGSPSSRAVGFEGGIRASLDALPGRASPKGRVQVYAKPIVGFEGITRGWYADLMIGAGVGICRGCTIGLEVPVLSLQMSRNSGLNNGRTLGPEYSPPVRIFFELAF